MRLFNFSVCYENKKNVFNFMEIYPWFNEKLLIIKVMVIKCFEVVTEIGFTLNNTCCYNYGKVKENMNLWGFDFSVKLFSGKQ